MTREEDVKTRICDRCHGALYYDHPQFPNQYIKCISCGHTKPKVEKIVSEDKDRQK